MTNGPWWGHSYYNILVINALFYGNIFPFLFLFVISFRIFTV